MFQFLISKFDIGDFETLIFDIDPPLPGPYYPKAHNEKKIMKEQEPIADD